jgi:hypothetical protein
VPLFGTTLELTTLVPDAADKDDETVAPRAVLERIADVKTTKPRKAEINNDFRAADNTKSFIFMIIISTLAEREADAIAPAIR